MHFSSKTHPALVDPHWIGGKTKPYDHAYGKETSSRKGSEESIRCPVISEPPIDRFDEALPFLPSTCKTLTEDRPFSVLTFYPRSLLDFVSVRLSVPLCYGFPTAADALGTLRKQPKIPKGTKVSVAHSVLAGSLCSSRRPYGKGTGLCRQIRDRRKSKAGRIFSHLLTPGGGEKQINVFQRAA